MRHSQSLRLTMTKCAVGAALAPDGGNALMQPATPNNNPAATMPNRAIRGQNGIRAGEFRLGADAVERNRRSGRGESARRAIINGSGTLTMPDLVSRADTIRPMHSLSARGGPGLRRISKCLEERTLKNRQKVRHEAD